MRGSNRFLSALILVCDFVPRTRPPAFPSQPKWLLTFSKYLRNAEFPNGFPSLTRYDVAHIRPERPIYPQPERGSPGDGYITKEALRGDEPLLYAP